MLIIMRTSLGSLKNYRDQHKLSRLDSMEKGTGKSVLNKCPGSSWMFEKY